MNIAPLLEEYARKRNYSSLYNATTAHNLLIGNSDAALVNQRHYEESEYLAANIKDSVRKYTRDKDIAIHIYRDFLMFLERKDVKVDVSFPPIAISNSFERLMFIAKYLQDPRHKISDLPDLLWISERTVEEDMKKLRGDHDDPIQVCGKVFKIMDLERSSGSVYFPSTAHPLFLSPNLTQVLVTLKGLKEMSKNPLYAQYAHIAAADIWEQLSDYAKTRIHYVLAELLPEELTWYESLRKNDNESFYSEYSCSINENVILDCFKNGKPFYIEYESNDGTCIYDNCLYVSGSLVDGWFEVTCTQGKLKLELDRVIRNAYTIEELL